MNFRSQIPLLVIFFFSCSQHVNKEPSSNELPTQKLDVIRLIIGGAGLDKMLDASGGIGSSMKYFHETYGSRAKNHLLVDPSVAEQLSINYKDAFVSQVSENALKSKIIEITQRYNPQKLVIFLATHGEADSGALCYKSTSSCTLSASELTEIIDALDAINLAKSFNDRLHQVLFVPLSCNNKLLADQMFDVLKKEPHKSFSLTMTHMKHDYPSICSNIGLSVGEALLIGNIKFFPRPNKENFKDWITTKERFKKFYTLNKINDLVEFINELIVNNHDKDGDTLTETVIKFGPNSPEIDTVEFELKPRELIIYTGNVIPKGCESPDEKFTCSPKQMLETIVVVPELEKFVYKVRQNQKVYTKDVFEVADQWNKNSEIYIHIKLP